MLNTNIGDLHPIMREPVSNLLDLLSAAYMRAETLTEFGLFEGYRSPERQTELYKTGKATKARAWISAHQYGLAVDIVPRVRGTWDWGDHNDYLFLKSAALRCGLRVPIPWDRVHVQHPDFEMLKVAIRRQH